MGADLYIQQIHKPIMEKYQPLFDAAVIKRDALPKDSQKWKAAQEEVTKYYDLMYSEGYFRDSYNCTSVLWTLDLSWWRDVTPLCDENRDLKGENLKKFRKIVANANQWLPSRRQLKKQHATVDQEGENCLEEWHKLYTEKRQRLLAFLDQAIQSKTSIHCSL